RAAGEITPTDGAVTGGELDPSRRETAGDERDPSRRKAVGDERAPLRLGIAGCGRIVERGYVPAALATPGVTIAAFADPDPERLAGCRELWERGGGKAAGYADVATLLERESVDLLVVAAPAGAHVPLAEAAAVAGVRSLVEKPPAPDLAGAQRLAALEPEPLLAFNRRFLQGVELLEKVPDEGWLELDLELRFRQTAWGAYVVRDEALLDAGVHLVDLACNLSGAAPIAVRRAVVEPQRAQFELELSRGRARVRCATDRRYREAVVVRDRGGKLFARSVHGQVRGRLASLRGTPEPLVLSLSRQLAALRDAGSTDPAFVPSGGMPPKGRTPLATAGDGAVAMAVVEAVRESAALDGAEVTVDIGAGVPA
ncbi:MAG TPA: Gfo/Idh/MocA family oxidoreductase, partial [Solirubrobacterales bacterium]|nr:Gfo/Idh/MocA family oxidoreductase [Solirubrobacterales bacterium]